MKVDFADKDSAGNGEKGSVAGIIALYSSSNLFRQIMGLANTFLKPKLLSPELLGLWSLLALLPSFASYIHLGSRTAMRFQVPQQLADGDEAGCRRMMGAVYFGTFFLNLALALALLCCGFFIPLEPPARWGLWSMAGVVMLTWYFEYQVSVLKAYQRFVLLSRMNYLRAALLSLFNVLLILLFGIYGLYAALLLSLLLTICYLRSRYNLPPPTAYRHSVFSGLVRSGFPIMAFNFGGLLVASSDKLIVSSMLGLEQLGYYGIAAMALSFLMQVPGASREVVESKLIAALQEDRELALQQYLVKPLLVTAYLVPIFVGPVVLLLPETVAFLLPNYLPGVAAAQILLFGAFPLSLTFVLRGGIVAAKVQGAASLAMGGVVLVNLFLSFLLVRLGGGIAGVALASGLSFGVLFFLLVQILQRRLGQIMPGAGQTPLWGPFWLMALLCLGGSAAQAYFSWPPLLELAGVLLIYGAVMLRVYNRTAIKSGCFPPFRWPSGASDG